MSPFFFFSFLPCLLLWLSSDSSSLLVLSEGAILSAVASFADATELALDDVTDDLELRLRKKNRWEATDRPSDGLCWTCNEGGVGPFRKRSFNDRCFFSPTIGKRMWWVGPKTSGGKKKMKS